MADVVSWGRPLIHPPERSLAMLPAEPSSSKLGGSGRREWWILSTKYFFHTCSILLCAVKWYAMGLWLCFPLKEGMLQFFVTLKNPSPQLALNLQTLGTLTSTLAITPPRQLNIGIIVFSSLSNSSWDTSSIFPHL
jgi:hypothetical protein